MRILFFWGSFFLAIVTSACLNLNGQLSGSCVCHSPSFGDLEGSLEFDIKQPSCDQITLDGSSLKIPGEVEEKSTVGQTENYMKLAMSWQNPAQDILSFQYVMSTDVNGQRIDNVALTGEFKQVGEKIILNESGLVDEDFVEIQCELYR